MASKKRKRKVRTRARSGNRAPATRASFGLVNVAGFTPAEVLRLLATSSSRSTRTSTPSNSGSWSATQGSELLRYGGTGPVLPQPGYSSPAQPGAPTAPAQQVPASPAPYVPPGVPNPPKQGPSGPYRDPPDGN